MSYDSLLNRKNKSRYSLKTFVTIGYLISFKQFHTFKVIDVFYI